MPALDEQLDLEIVELIAITIRGLKRNGFNDTDIRLKLRKLHDEQSIQAGLDLCASEDANSQAESYSLKENSDYFGWYDGPKQEGEFHWPRLKRALLDKASAWNEEMISSLDESSNLVTSHLAPPDSKKPIKCKGLVLGYIQSGKTANFSATIAKAVDEGYKLVIVLGGLHNNLRKQTELRLREELVNPIDGKTCTTLTTDEETGDFKRKQATKATRTLSRRDGFTLAVIKKNSSVLRNFRAWLEEADPEILKNCPTLIIDDESDQASVNTKKEDQDPTAINNHLRELLNLFNVVSYVGYTATPFANVFIDSTNEDDLYPKDFIIALNKPKTYYGPEELFGIDRVNGKHSSDGLPVVRHISEFEAAEIKESLKQSFNLEDYKSLMTAIDSFYLAAAVRLTRGQWKNHMTMLVHLTHLTRPQDDIQQALEKYANILREKIEDNDLVTKNRLEKLFNSDFKSTTELILGNQQADFEKVWKNMLKFAQQVEVILDNSNSSNRLTFDPELRNHEPLWGIVVGGNTLSRGLTLEGLTTSYFVRDSKAYDTLLQMGRWFGYRKGYVDLTRIFVTADLFDNFYHLATVEQEIRDEIGAMAVNQEKPIDVALRIRKHPSMLVTAKNKMRNAVSATLTFSGTKIQTHQINTTDKSKILKNKNSVSELLGKIEQDNIKTSQVRFKDLENCILYKGVSSERILQFLDSVCISENNAKFDKKLIQNYIQDLTAKGELLNWSVSVMSLKQGIPIKVGNLEVYPLSRTVKHESRNLDGQNESTLRAISTPGEELIDLDDQFKFQFKTTDDILEPKDGLRKSDTQARHEFRPEDRGILMIYPLQSNIEMSDSHFKESRNQISTSYPLRGVEQLFAFSIVFPKSKVEKGPAAYLINPLKKNSANANAIKPSAASKSEIKVLNIAQPNAYDVFHNGKNVENRTTATNIRGMVAIYASKNKAHFSDSITDFSKYEFGAIVGFAEIVDCITEREVNSATRKWFTGPYGWLIKNVILLPKPIYVSPPKGAIKWWTLSGEKSLDCLNQLTSEQLKALKHSAES